MRVGGNRRVADLREQITQRGLAREIGAQHQRIDEQADERLDVCVRTVGDGRADGHLRLSGEPREQGLEHGEQQHERRHAFALSKRVQAFGQLETQRKGQRRATSADLRGTRAVGGQIQRREVGKLTAPVLRLTLELGAGEPVALPQRVVGVLHGQRRQRERFVAQKSRIASAEFTHQHAGGPAIGDDVMHREEQHMLFGREAQQLRAQQRTMLQIEGTRGFVLRQTPDFRGPCIGSERVQLNERQRDPQLGSDALNGLSVMIRETRAQALVTCNEGIQGSMEGGHVERATQAHGRRDVIGGLPRIQLLEKPQPFLRKRERKIRRARQRVQGRQRARAAFRLVERKRLGERCDAGRIEQGAQRQLDREGFAQARNELRCKQRVSTEREEVIEDAHTLETEHAGKALRERLLDRGARCDIVVMVLPLRVGQGTAIELAVGGERQSVERHECRWHHIVGQTRGEMLAQEIGIDPGNERDIGDELLILRIFMSRTREHHRFTHSSMAGELRLDLPELDTEAANLDLMVVAAEELETAVRQMAREVARAIEASTRNERIVDEALRRELRPIEVTTRHARAADVELAHRADRRQLTLRIQHVDGQVGNTHPDRAVAVGTILARQRPVGYVHGRLGDAVHVDQLRLPVRMPRVPGVEHRRIQRLPAKDHVAQGSGFVAGFLCLDERAKCAGRLIQNGDALPLKQAKEIGCEARHMLRHDHELAAMAQRAPQLPHREIEGERVEQAPDIVFIEAEPVLRRVEQAHDLRMLDHHALRLAGGAGGVDHVGEVRRGDPRLRIVRREFAIGRCVRIDHGERTRVAQRFAARRVGKQQARRGIGKDVGETLARIGRIERHIGRARLENGQQRDDHADAALDAQRDSILRAHAQRDQTMRKPVRARIELRIGERLVFEDQRDCIGHASSLLLEQLMDAHIRGISRVGFVPGLDQQGARFGRHDLEPVHRRLGGLLQRMAEAFERLLHVAAHGVGRHRLNDLDSQFQTVAIVVDRQGERIIRAFLRTQHVDAGEGALVAGGRRAVVPVVEQGAEKRCRGGHAAAALRERERRMFIPQQRRETCMGVTHAVSHAGRIDVDANGQGVDQKTQHAVSAGLRPAQQHRAEHGLAALVLCADRAQHTRPREVTETGQIHPEPARLGAQPYVEIGGYRDMGFCHRGAVALQIGEAERQRGFADFGEHLPKESLVLQLARTEPRLGDEVAERLRVRKLPGAARHEHLHFRLHDIERGVIADQVMPVELDEPAPGPRLGGDRQTQ
ncbi:hypothetical protein AWB78_08267 [Caballeronia calidae]|uniref:Uncharacterized protein n=1 Tax=Caballeronia calidae TaxID=1777139 RepID=A0A158EIZ4_9BURK|nr:hypothetical protein AWB78_08267 [Caballeronia calidae]